MPKNLFEHGPLVELKRVTSVEQSKRTDKRATAAIELCDLDERIEGRSVLMVSRLLSNRIEVGDIAKVESDGPSWAKITEIYRDGMRIHPEKAAKRAALKEHLTRINRLKDQLGLGKNA